MPVESKVEDKKPEIVKESPKKNEKKEDVPDKEEPEIELTKKEVVNTKKHLQKENLVEEDQ